jgi:hypothetical protein
VNRSQDRRRGRRDQAARQALAALVASGVAVCWRCEQTIQPTDDWDAGHVDSLGEGGHPDGRRVPEHASCNRSAGGQLAHQLARGRRVDRSRFLG